MRPWPTHSPHPRRQRFWVLGTSPRMTILERGASEVRIAVADELADARVDLFAELAAVEDAVVADADLDVVGLEVTRDARAQGMRRLGLADAGDVVELALHRHQADVGDQVGPHEPPAMLELALG